MNGNEPAMPVPEVGENGCYTNVVNKGLTKRELFAAMAMQGMLADPESSTNPNTVACLAIDCADCLIKQLSEPPK